MPDNDLEPHFSPTLPPCSFRRLSDGVRSAEGTAIGEYAILLAILVSGVLIAIQAIGYATREALDDLHATSSASTERELQKVAFRVEPAPVDASPAVQAMFMVPTIELLISILILVFCLFLLRRQRLRLAHSSGAAEPVEHSLEEFEQQQVFVKRQQIYQVLSTNLATLFNCQVEVRHLMSKRVTVVRPQASVAQMKKLMEEKQLRHLPVCDERGQLLGIVSDRDLHREPTLLARQIMTSEPITIAPDALVSSAITLLLSERISSLPVVRDGKLCGLMTTTDLIMALQCALQVLNHSPDEAVEAAAASAREQLQLSEATAPDVARNADLAAV